MRQPVCIALHASTVSSPPATGKVSSNPPSASNTVLRKATLQLLKLLVYPSLSTRHTRSNPIRPPPGKPSRATAFPKEVTARVIVFPIRMAPPRSPSAACCNVSGASSQSVSVKNRYWDSAALAPRLRHAAGPWFSFRRTTRKRGSRIHSYSEGSVEASSTITTSKAVKVCRMRESYRVRSRCGWGS
ncbi:MAG: hypothetical protein BWY09_02913 [Candidatus Hydrogenedentes bacterium ADurb.Bin179]|nr:MAG: hypothetical protein BWY09_02913 [Candidatus Hydrogenedentes bacterium ADurb.Bin179]